MKKLFLSIILIISLMFSCCYEIIALNINNFVVAESKLMNSELPSVPEHIVENIIGIHNSQKIYSKEDAIKFDSMLDALSMLYLTLEYLESECVEGKTNNLSVIEAIQNDIEKLEEDIVDSGAILLTPQQVGVMFSEVSLSPMIGGDVVCPSDTENTRYYLYGPYTINTNEGDCKYYYVTATTISEKSNMRKLISIPMNEDKVSAYVNAVVDIYVQKIAGSILDSEFLWTKYFPWELLLAPPASHQETTATYVILAQYVTNVKFVWCYSETLHKYFLGVVLNSTSVTEIHNNFYVYNGKSYGDSMQRNYTIKCKNYDNVEAVTRSYWESYENVHIEYIKSIKYYYNESLVTTVTPPYAQGYYSMN